MSGERMERGVLVSTTVFNLFGWFFYHCIRIIQQVSGILSHSSFIAYSIQSRTLIILHAKKKTLQLWHVINVAEVSSGKFNCLRFSIVFNPIRDLEKLKWEVGYLLITICCKVIGMTAVVLRSPLGVLKRGT